MYGRYLYTKGRVYTECTIFMFTRTCIYADLAESAKTCQIVFLALMYICCVANIFRLCILCLGLLGGGPMAKNGEKWRKMAKNGDGEFGFFICQIRHFSPIFDFGILHSTDFQTANHLETLQSHYWHRYRTNATHIE